MKDEFRVFAHGESFDPQAYLATTPLKFPGLWLKGESKLPNHPKLSGVFKVLGDGKTVPLLDQERIAIEFLAINRDALKALAQFPGVTTFILGLHYYIELEKHKGIVGFCMGPPPRLMWHALDIGIELTYYVTLDRRSEWEADMAAESPENE